MKHSIFIIVILYAITSYAQVSDDCKGVDKPEKVRIYYANGMRNNDDNIIENYDALVSLVGISPSLRDFGFAINKTDGFILDFLQTFRQKSIEFPEREYTSDKFWTWVRNLTIAPEWFKSEYRWYLFRFTNAFVQNDPDLQVQVSDYRKDLKQGKKVVIVAHSQGNLYANFAYRYFQNHPEYSKYKRSIGIVGVGTVSNQVADQTPFNGQYGYYTLNAYDGVVNLLRNRYPVLPPSPTRGKFTEGDALNHSFKFSYIAEDGFRSIIRNHILRKINSLVQPEIDFECKQPNDVPIEVKTLPAREVTPTSGGMYGEVVSGKQIDVYFVYKLGGTIPPRCSEYAYKHDGKGKYNTDSSFKSSLFNLTSGVIYSYRACGKREDGTVSEGNIKTFVTIFT